MIQSRRLRLSDSWGATLHYTRSGRDIIQRPGKADNRKQRLEALSLLNSRLQTPFDTVENAHDYVRLLVEAIAEAKSEIATDLGTAAQAQPERRLQALQVVQFKLDKLEQHLQSSSRLLNDLRSLRRLLFDERPESAPAGHDSAA